MKTRRMPRALALGCGALLAIGVAACGDDESDSGSAATSSTTTAKQELTGKPVTVVVQLPLKTPVSDNSDAVKVAQTAVDRLNANGGLNGSEVKLQVCNDKSATDEMACIKKAKAAGAVAFIGSSFLYNPKAAGDALVDAKIPNVAALAIQQVEYGTKINYPVTAPSFGFLACPSQLQQTVGAKKVSAIAQDLPVQKELLGTIKAVATASKVPFGASVGVPVSQTDFSGAVQTLKDAGTDAVVDVLGPPTLPAFITALRSVGENYKGFCVVSSTITYGIMDQLGADAEKVYLTSGLPSTTEADAEKYPLIKDFRDAVAASDVTPGSPDNSFNVYLGLEVLRQAAEDVEGDISGAKVIASLDRLKPDLSKANMPPLDFSKEVPAPGLGRLFNPVVALRKWDSGVKDFVSTDGKPVNVLELFAALQQAK